MDDTSGSRTVGAIAPTPAPSAPGKCGGKIDFGLHENVVRVDVLGQVKAARKEVDEAMTEARRGQSYTDSVYYSNSKHTNKFSDSKLSNTLTAQLLNATDTRKLTGTTHVRTARLPEDTSTSYGDWNSSTVTRNPKAAAQQVEQLTSTCQAKTRKKALELTATGRYQSPVQRVEALNEAIRAHKANPRSDLDELTAQYGPEGAQAMQEIMSMRQPQGPRPRIRTTKDDLEAVKALDAFNLDDPGDEDAAEEVNLSGR